MLTIEIRGVDLRSEIVETDALPIESRHHYSNKPPYTEQYVRGCERTVKEMIPTSYSIAVFAIMAVNESGIIFDSLGIK